MADNQSFYQPPLYEQIIVNYLIIPAVCAFAEIYSPPEEPISTPQDVKITPPPSPLEKTL